MAKLKRETKLRLAKGLEELCIGGAVGGATIFLAGALFNDLYTCFVGAATSGVSAVIGVYTSGQRLKLTQDYYADNQEDQSSNHSYPNTDNYEVQ